MRMAFKECALSKPIFVHLGLYSGPLGIREELDARNFRVGDCAADLIDHLPGRSAELRIRVRAIRLRALGLRHGGTLAEIAQHAVPKGLKLCPSDAGPALRLAYAFQPLGEVVFIAMAAVKDAEGIRCIFEVDHSLDGLWIRGCDAFSDSYFPPTSHFLFQDDP